MTRVHTSLVVLAILPIACHPHAVAPRAESSTQPIASRPLTPEAQRVLHELSRLSPENTLAHLPRIDAPPAKQESLIAAPIDTWSQPGVNDGYARALQFDPSSHRFWIFETGGFAGHVHWYGPLVMDDHGSIQVAAD